MIARTPTKEKLENKGNGVFSNFAESVKNITQGFSIFLLTFSLASFLTQTNLPPVFCLLSSAVEKKQSIVTSASLNLPPVENP